MASPYHIPSAKTNGNRDSSMMYYDNKAYDVDDFDVLIGNRENGKKNVDETMVEVVLEDEKTGNGIDGNNPLYNGTQWTSISELNKWKMEKDTEAHLKRSKQLAAIWIVIACAIVVAIIVTVPLVIVLGESDQTGTTTVVMTTTEVVLVPKFQSFEGDMIITSVVWSDELNDTTSKAYNELAGNVTETLDLIYEDIADYNKSEVISFREGSVLCDFVILFRYQENTNLTNDTVADVLVDAFTNNGTTDEYPISVDPESITLEETTKIPTPTPTEPTTQPRDQTTADSGIQTSAIQTTVSPTGNFSTESGGAKTTENATPATGQSTTLGQTITPTPDGITETTMGDAAPTSSQLTTKDGVTPTPDQNTSLTTAATTTETTTASGVTPTQDQNTSLSTAAMTTETSTNDGVTATPDQKTSLSTTATTETTSGPGVTTPPDQSTALSTTAMATETPGNKMSTTIKTTTDAESTSRDPTVAVTTTGIKTTTGALTSTDAPSSEARNTTLTQPKSTIATTAATTTMTTTTATTTDTKTTTDALTSSAQPTMEKQTTVATTPPKDETDAVTSMSSHPPSTNPTPDVGTTP